MSNWFLLIFHLFAGVNLKSGQQGIFPSMYATDLQFLEEETGNQIFIDFIHNSVKLVLWYLMPDKSSSSLIFNAR